MTFNVLIVNKNILFPIVYIVISGKVSLSRDLEKIISLSRLIKYMNAWPFGASVQFDADPNKKSACSRYNYVLFDTESDSVKVKGKIGSWQW